MVAPKVLPIMGYHGEQVPNHFRRQEGATGHLAILLPGLGYTCDMPLFYYAQRALTEAGADLLRVEYAYNYLPGFQALSPPEQLSRLVADAIAAFRTGLAQRDYEAVTIVGKSLGTLAMGHLLTMDERPDGRTRAVWLTPLLRQEGLRKQIIQYGGHSLFAIGTADPQYFPAYLDEVREATGGEVVVVAGADHSIDVSGDMSASIAAIAQVVTAVQEFIAP